MKLTKEEKDILDSVEGGGMEAHPWLQAGGSALQAGGTSHIAKG